VPKTPKGGGRGGNKEVIAPPKKPALRAGSRDLRRGDPAGGRVLADEAVAKRQGVVKTRPKKK